MTPDSRCPRPSHGWAGVLLSPREDAPNGEGQMDDVQHSTEEFGDVLFSLINAARLYHINPDNALEKTNRKFIKRFNYVEAAAKASGRTLSDLSLEEMDSLWRRAKSEA